MWIKKSNIINCSCVLLCCPVEVSPEVVVLEAGICPHFISTDFDSPGCNAGHTWTILLFLNWNRKNNTVCADKPYFNWPWGGWFPKNRTWVLSLKEKKLLMEIGRSFHFVPAEFLILQAKIGAIFHLSITFCLNLEVMAFCIILFTASGWKMLQIQYQIRQTHLFIKPVGLMGYQFSKQFINSSILGWGRGVNGEASEGESVELWPRAAVMHEMRSCTVDVLILANVAAGRKFSCYILERVCFSFLSL